VKRFWYLHRGRGRIRVEIDEELRTHLEMRTEALMADGMTPEDARREAVRQFGDLSGTLEYCHQQDIQKDDAVQRRLLLEDLFQDARTGLRGMLRAPLTTLVIVTTVGLGIGATTTIFAALNAALLGRCPTAIRRNWSAFITTRRRTSFQSPSPTISRSRRSRRRSSASPLTVLFNVSAADPRTFVAVSALLVVVALAACALPAGRALRVEAASVLRDE
jgi:hypothetical protein